jgi:hypothetical protein
MISATYPDDSREDPLHELRISIDDQGDIYVQVLPEGHRFGPAVRLCASGGAEIVAPGLRAAARRVPPDDGAVAEVS